MEERIIGLLDCMDVGQTEELLGAAVKTSICRKTVKQIKKTVREKTGMKEKRKRAFYRRLITCAAALTMTVAMLYMVGFDQVSAAIAKVFAMIPGYGIVENNDRIKYILSEQTSAAEGDAMLTLNQVIAGEDSVTVLFTINHTNRTDEEIIKTKKEDEKNASGVRETPNISLYAGEGKYTQYSGSWSDGGRREYYWLTYMMKKDDIGTSINYRLLYEANGLSVTFKLKKYDSYTDLEQIGPTVQHNGISVTAVPQWSDGKLEVMLYTINNSHYTISSLSKYNTGYLGRDLHLVSDNTIIDYTEKEYYGVGNGKFVFALEPEDRNLILKIPYVIVRSNEEKKLTLKIPEEGEKRTVNKTVVFRDGAMTVTDVEKTAQGELKLTLRYDKTEKNKIMMRANFHRTNIFARDIPASWSGVTNENDLMTTVFIPLEKGERDLIRLRVKNPVYCLTDEYLLELSRETK